MNSPCKHFHDRCFAYILKLSVKECLGLIHCKIAKLRKMVEYLQSSLKGEDVFNDFEDELGLKIDLPSLNVETHWSSTFKMIKKGFLARRGLSAEVSRQEDLAEIFISESK